MTIQDTIATEQVRRRAALALLTTAVFWGLSFPLGKSISMLHEALAPDESEWLITISTIWPRFLIAVVMLAAVARGTLLTISRREAWQGLGLSLFLSGGIFLQMDGLRYTEASTSAFLSQFYVIMLPMVVYGRQRRWPAPRMLVGTIMVLVGVAVLADVDWRTFRAGRGELETLLSTFFFTAQILWLDRRTFRENRVLPVTFVMFAVTAGIFLVGAVGFASEPAAIFQPARSVPWVVLTAALAVICTFAALTMMNTWQPKLSATEGGLIYATEPVWASLMVLFIPAWFSRFAGFNYPNETVTVGMLIGGGLITAANILVQLAPPRRAEDYARHEII